MNFHKDETFLNQEKYIDIYNDVIYPVLKRIEEENSVKLPVKIFACSKEAEEVVKEQENFEVTVKIRFRKTFNESRKVFHYESLFTPDMFPGTGFTGITGSGDLRDGIIKSPTHTMCYNQHEWKGWQT